MEITAKLSNLRTAPRKVRQTIDLVRGKSVPEAQSILSFTVSRSARVVLNLLNSAVASAKHNHQLDESNLYIFKITADEGPKMKRWHPMSRGRAYPIIKRSSHIALVLKEINPTVKESTNTEEVQMVNSNKTKETKVKSKKIVKEAKVKKDLKTASKKVKK